MTEDWDFNSLKSFFFPLLLPLSVLLNKDLPSHVFISEFKETDVLHENIDESHLFDINALIYVIKIGFFVFSCHDFLKIIGLPWQSSG